MRQDLGHGLEGSTLVDPNKHVNKNNYYHNFKTRLESQYETRFKSQVERVYPTYLFKKKIIQRNLILTNFVFKKINKFFTCVLFRIDLSFLGGLVKSNLSLS